MKNVPPFSIKLETGNKTDGPPKTETSTKKEEVAEKPKPPRIVYFQRGKKGKYSLVLQFFNWGGTPLAKAEVFLRDLDDPNQGAIKLDYKTGEDGKLIYPVPAFSEPRKSFLVSGHLEDGYAISREVILVQPE